MTMNVPAQTFVAENIRYKESNEELKQPCLKALKYSRAFIHTAKSHSFELTEWNQHSVFCVPGTMANRNAALDSQTRALAGDAENESQVGPNRNRQRGSEAEAAAPALLLSCQDCFPPCAVFGEAEKKVSWQVCEVNNNSHM